MKSLLLCERPSLEREIYQIGPEELLAKFIDPLDGVPYPYIEVLLPAGGGVVIPLGGKLPAIPRP
jgi:hypothetical protein